MGNKTAKYRGRADAPSEQLAVMKKQLADNEEDYYHVDSFYLEAIITKAIQEYEQSRERISIMEQEDKELREQIAGLKQENRVLQERIQRLEDKFGKIISSLVQVAEISGSVIIFLCLIQLNFTVSLYSSK